MLDSVTNTVAGNISSVNAGTGSVSIETLPVPAFTEDILPATVLVTESSIVTSLLCLLHSIKESKIKI